MNGYFEEANGNKYLTLIPTNEDKVKIEKYEELWIKIRDLIKSITKTDLGSITKIKLIMIKYI